MHGCGDAVWGVRAEFFHNHVRRRDCGVMEDGIAAVFLRFHDQCSFPSRSTLRMLLVTQERVEQMRRYTGI
jgi:hypothetical protein